MAVTPRLRRIIKQEAGYRCAIPTCNCTSPLEIHHIVPIADGGDDNPQNLICLCRNCHGRCHNGEIDNEAIVQYKQRLIRISVDLFLHEHKYLEALYRGELIELSTDDVSLANRLERRGFVNIIEIPQNNSFRLAITDQGRSFIE